MTRKKGSTLLENIVRHPRYGSTPRPSGLELPEAEIRRAHWTLMHATIFPETALRADTSVQNFSMYPREYYVDILRACRSCKRPFIFSAREQKYWFETLRFYVDANCVECSDCRRGSRTVQRTLRRYSDLLAKESRSRKELMQLVDDATFLLEHGTLKKINDLGAIKNQAVKTIPEYPGVALLMEAIGRANAAADSKQ